MWSIRRSPSTVSDPEIATLAHCPLLPQLPYSVEELQPTGTALTYWWPSPSVTQCRNSTSRWSLPLPIATADQRKALRRIDQEWRWFQCKGKDMALSREVLKTKNLPQIWTNSACRQSWLYQHWFLLDSLENFSMRNLPGEWTFQSSSHHFRPSLSLKDDPSGYWQWCWVCVTNCFWSFRRNIE